MTSDEQSLSNHSDFESSSYRLAGLVSTWLKHRLRDIIGQYLAERNRLEGGSGSSKANRATERVFKDVTTPSSRFALDRTPCRSWLCFLGLAFVPRTECHFASSNRLRFVCRPFLSQPFYPSRIETSESASRRTNSRSTRNLLKNLSSIFNKL